MAANDLLDLVADELEAAIGQTLAERRAEPARQFASRLVETDSDTALEDKSAERLGLKLAFVLLAEWHRSLRSDFDGPALVDLLSALIWLTAGVTATHGGGDPAWLRQGESR
ncbi:MAG TPA: hypothetical protein VH141_11130 [Pseudonocardia sp.]|jgi:hypothetical protein|nr:hypothetical protein [Pseudonocardia sp.]